MFERFRNMILQAIITFIFSLFIKMEFHNNLNPILQFNTITNREPYAKLCVDVSS